MLNSGALFAIQKGLAVITFVMAALLFENQAQAHAVHSAGLGTIQKFTLTKCQTNTNLCLKTEALTAIGSQFKPIFVLKSAHLKIQNKNGVTLSDVKADNGYIDFENNQLVLSMNGGTEERAYSLTDFSETTWKLK